MNNDETLEFLEDYRSHVCLWDIQNKSYTNKTKRNDACSDLAKKYNMTEKGVRNKIKSLRSYFSKEHEKLIAKKSGAGTDSKYETPWFAYSSLLFILDSVTPRETKDSLHSISANIEETLDDDEDANEKSRSSFTSSEQPSVSNLDIQKKDVSENINTSERIRTQRNLLKRKKEEDEKKEEEAFAFIKTAAMSVAQKDDCNIFGQMVTAVTAEIHKLNPKNKVIAKNKIQNILFDLQLQGINETETQSYILSPRGELYATSSNSENGSASNLVCFADGETPSGSGNVMKDFSI